MKLNLPAIRIVPHAEIEILKLNVLEDIDILLEEVEIAVAKRGNLS